jgi:cysteinyl-tRNA synthetase
VVVDRDHKPSRAGEGDAEPPRPSRPVRLPIGAGLRPRLKKRNLVITLLSSAALAGAAGTSWLRYGGDTSSVAPLPVRAETDGPAVEEGMQDSQEPPAAGFPTARPWSSIRSWVYWLDGPRLDEIATSGFELAVIDYSRDGSAAGEFSTAEIEALRHAGCQRRVLAYLSIGEAEHYRFYWQPGWKAGSPDWIVAQDPDWEGNYWVRYWDPAWQQLIISQYLERIIAQGFDGVYLDRVDAYEEGFARGHEPEMVDFVRAIATYARSKSPLGADFGVLVQNAEALGAKYPDYVALLTGIAREEVYVEATNQPTTASARARVQADLDRFLQHSRGPLVLTVDYADRPERVRECYERARAKGYVPYVTTVDLDRMRVNPGFDPVCQPASFR